jgi:gluconolactonase
MVRRWTWVVAGALAMVGCGDDGGTEVSTVGDPATSSTPATGEATAGDSTTATSTSSGAADDSTGATTGPIEGCWADLPPGEVEVLYDGFGGGSEGVAFGADGSLYVTTSDAGAGTVWRIDAQGTPAVFSELPYALGLAALADGGFIVASIGETTAADGSVYAVDPDGIPSVRAQGMIDSPNFVAIAPDGSALVSDDFDTRVFRVALDGEVSVVIADVPSPNGMAYSPSGDAFYVASTFTPDGQVTRYEVDAGGLPLEATAVEILQLGPGSSLDGMAVDEAGFVYVAANIKGEIWRVDGAATSLVEGELVASGLATPASLAFGRGVGFDPCSIYASELLGSRVVRVAVGVEGGPLFD